MSNRASAKPLDARRGQLLKALFARLGAASTDFPSARCWSQRRLLGEIAGVRRAVGGTGEPTARHLLDHLVMSGLARLIEIEPATGRGWGGPYYLVDLEGAGSKADVAPIELLHAAQPRGIVAYFSALSFHGLTTQLPTSHHIVLPEQANPDRKPTLARQEDFKMKTLAVEPRRARNSLGTHLFNFEGVGYYESRRSLRVPDMLTQYLSPRSLVRITGPLQTLLDCLHVPQRCGGPETVFEAWQTGIEELDELLLCRCLQEMSHSPTTRRVGAMLELLEHPPTNTGLVHVLETGWTATAPVLDLLPGISYGSLNHRWGVRVP